MFQGYWVLKSLISFIIGPVIILSGMSKMQTPDETFGFVEIALGTIVILLGFLLAFKIYFEKVDRDPDGVEKI